MTSPLAAQSVFCAVQSFVLARPIAPVLVIKSHSRTSSDRLRISSKKNDEIATDRPLGRDVYAGQELAFDYGNAGPAIAQPLTAQELQYF